MIEDFAGELTQVGELGMIAVERLGPGGKLGDALRVASPATQSP